jgi:thiamine-monophosphate kinase
VTASIDSSDGLAWSLHEISRANSIGFIIDNPPVAPEVRDFAKIHNFDPLELSLYGGEEYELLITVKQQLWKEAKNAIEQIDGSLVRIGRVTEEKHLLLKDKEETIVIETRGWEHFRKA